MNGIRSLNAGAYANLPQQDIRLSGDHRPTYTQRRRNQMAGGGISNLKNIQGKDHMLAYITPGEANSLQNMGGQKVMTPEGIPAYPPWDDPGASPGTSSSRGVSTSSRSYNPGAGGVVSHAPVSVAAPSYQTVHDTGAVSQTPYNAQAVVNAAVAQAAADQEALNTNLVSPIGNLIESPVTGTEGRLDAYTGDDQVLADYGSGTGETITATELAIANRPEDFPEVDHSIKEAIKRKVDASTYVGGESGPVYGDVGTGTTTTGTTDTRTGGDNLPLINDLVNVTDTGLTDEEKATAATADFEASVAEQMAANEAAKAELPFKDYYVGGDPTAEQVAFMKASGAAPSTVGLEQYAARGGRVPAAFGGVMGQDGRRQYGLGSIFKKAGKALKSVVKSPIGKIALATALYKSAPFLSQKFPGISGGLKNLWLGKPQSWKTAGDAVARKGGIWPWIKDNKMLTAGALATLSPFLAGEEEEDEKLEAMYRGEGLDIPGIRRAVGKKGLKREDYPFMPTDYYAAQGGRAGYEGGLLVDDEDDYVSPREAALAALYNPRRMADGGRIGYQGGGNGAGVHDPLEQLVYLMGKRAQGTITSQESDTLDKLIDETGFMSQKKAQGGRIGYAEGGIYEKALTDAWRTYKEQGGTLSLEEFADGWMKAMMKGNAQGGRIGAQEGGLMDLGGMEKDYRQEGGFVPIGGQEKADDVPARLSKNEFVFTADAVRNAGGGDIDAGAEVMENLMEHLEAGGEVSEDSQGLEGARDMFANAQQLEKRII